MRNKKAGWETRFFNLDLIELERQDSNVRLGAPNALISSNAAQGFQSRPNFFLDSACFVLTI
tara:strand:+ start:296 stop:481 length:186 start_codon:yes stop_codon:yes gene_type:complete